MRRTVCVAIFAIWTAGCQEDEHFPPGEGGGPSGGGGSGRIDGGPDAGGADAGGGGDAGIQLEGRVCDPADMRDPLADCDGTDLAGIDVVELISSQSDETDTEGRFALPVAMESDQVLAIGFSDPETRDALVPVRLWNGNDLVAPRMTQTSWDQFIIGILGLEPDDTASVVLYVRDENNEPVVGAQVFSEPEAGMIFYDDPFSPLLWSQGGLTGPSGAVLLTDIQVDITSQLSVGVAADQFLLTVPIGKDQLTWARLVLQ